jgi:DNA topoisomerase-2
LNGSREVNRIIMDITNTYRKQTHREHILSLPDTYIGSIETADEEVFLHAEEGQFIPVKVPINPGFYKLVDELLVNAHDHVIRLRQRKSENLVKHIEINCTPNTFAIKNDGESIDVAHHPEHNMYIPQLIFGELLTSTNYDKDEKKLVGGKNGYGVKLVNIFAKKLEIEIIDSGRKVLYTQTFSENMTKASTPVIKSSKAKSSVSLTWTPDFSRFGFPDCIPEQMIRLIERRVYDLAMTVGKEVKVSWNGTLVKCRSLVDYAKAYGCEPVLYESPNERWQIAITPTPLDKFFQSSFVNGIWTSKGGTHVDAVTSQIVNHVVEYLETKKKVKVKPGLVRDHLGVFIVSLIENPSFTSQTKETLTTKQSAFGSSPKLSEETLKKVVSKLGIVEKILEAQAVKDTKDNSKTDGKKQSRITGIPKLDDAVYAGTSKSSQCTLILTEGDSAKAMALSGLSQEQRKSYGVYPLKGKVLNVKDTSDSKVEQTKEIAELKKILGLVSGKKYTDTSSLRYGSILIMTDQDYDGSHIRGLLINLFHELWHELIAIPGFITYMATPIVKAHKGKEMKNFYSQYEYEQWREGEGKKGWKVKYYKGLGTSTRDEAKEYFKELSTVKYTYSSESDEAIELAFNKQRADDRKVWLKGYDKSALIPAGTSVPYTDFIHKDLIHFSNYNLERAIPSVMDGLKVSQRKILYAALKRNLTQEIRVAQFAGYVSEHTGYHHGEASLTEAIIGMAQDFVGANNIAWLVPQGQFGTRLQGGKDSASPRYIHTYLQPIVKKLVPEADFPVLTYRDDDGLPVEPEWYAPVLPMLLINGARGIGTGYSTSIPCYDKAEIKTMLLKWLDNEEGALLKPMKPYFKGFKGTVSEDGTAIGVYKKEKDEFVVTELPPGTWTADYREWLEKQLAEGAIKDFVDTSTDTDVNIRIKGIQEPVLVKSLTDKLKTSNMHAFNNKGIVTKYASPNDMLIEFANVRLALYEKRRLHQIRALQTELPYHENVVRFIEDQISDEPKINLRKQTRAQCDALLAGAKYSKVEDSYEYILRLPVSAFTLEQIEKHTSKLKSIRSEIATLEATTAADMWIDDLQQV